MFVPNKPTNRLSLSFMLSCFSTVFCRFLRPYRRCCPNIKKLACLSNFFRALNQNGKFPAGKMGPIRWAIRTQHSPHIA